jgi:hypothetical protein
MERGVAARASIGAGESTRVHQNPSTAVGFNGPQRRARFPRRKLRTRHGDSVTSSAREGKGSAVRGHKPARSRARAEDQQAGPGWQPTESVRAAVCWCLGRAGVKREWAEMGVCGPFKVLFFFFYLFFHF